MDVDGWAAPRKNFLAHKGEPSGFYPLEISFTEVSTLKTTSLYGYPTWNFYPRARNTWSGATLSQSDLSKHLPANANIFPFSEMSLEFAKACHSFVAGGKKVCFLHKGGDEAALLAAVPGLRYTALDLAHCPLFPGNLEEWCSLHSTFADSVCRKVRCSFSIHSNGFCHCPAFETLLQALFFHVNTPGAAKEWLKKKLDLKG